MNGVRLMVLALLASLGLTGPAHAALEELRDLVDQHPTDPDLLWAWVGALDDAGRTNDAANALQDFIALWPERRPDATSRLGRLLYRSGRYSEALDALDAAVFADPMDGPAHFHRGLSLRALGRHKDAERALRVAARVEPALEVEALFLAGLSHLDVGEAGRGSHLLSRVMEIAPESEWARQAELLLGGRRAAHPPQTRRLQLVADAGFELDTNVTLEGDSAQSPTDETDARAVWGTGVSYRFFANEAASASFGYRYSESAHADLDSYDMQNHLVFLSGQIRPWERSTLRLDTFASDGHVDNDRYARSWAVRPNLLYTLGERAGVTRAYLEFEKVHYQEDSVLESLSRDGRNYTLGVEHYVPFPAWAGAWGSAAVRLAENETPSSRSRDLLGFASAYAHRAAQAALRVSLPVGRTITSELETRLTYARYRHDNVIHGLFDAPTLAEAERRRDAVAEVSLALSRPLTKYTRVELRWRGTHQHSNVSLYKYNRSIVGLYLRAQTF